MGNDEQHLRKRYAELSRRSYDHGTYYFTDFLSVADAAVVCETVRSNEYALFGGINGCERVMARFGDPAELGYEQEFPIKAIKIEPLIEKFADDLNHRDYLGALMNLGIERDVIGDIIVRGKSAYVFAADRIAGFIIENLNKVKHTNVKCILMTTDELDGSFTAELCKESLIIPSERLDVIVSKLYNISRSRTNMLFRERKIYVNGRLCENNSVSVSQGDVIAVRGYGKFIYEGVQYVTKKGRLSASVKVYT